MKKYIVFIILFASYVCSNNKMGYFCYPAIHKNIIVFVSENNLWKSDLLGENTYRLTTYSAEDLYPAISFDGKMIAFSRNLQNNCTEIFVMPINGGVPKQITYEGERAYVVGWTKDNEIIYSTVHYSTLCNRQLAIINPITLKRKIIPLSQAVEGSWNEKNELFFTRLPFNGSHTKRYKGGMAKQIWKFSSNMNEAVLLSNDYKGTNACPMWWRERLYFISDRDNIMNIYSMNSKGKDLQQHTFHKNWDVRWPSLSQGNIVYHHRGDLRVLSLINGSDNMIPIDLISDYNQLKEHWIEKPINFLKSMHISKDGNYISLISRGRLFIVSKNNNIFEICPNKNFRFYNVNFLSNEKSLVALADKSGKIGFWKINLEEEKQIMQITDTEVISFKISPDGKKVVYFDSANKIYIYNFDNKSKKQIGYNKNILMICQDFAWSKDSQFLAFCLPASNTFNQILIYSCSEDKSYFLTSDRFNSYSPVWSEDGKWLYFLSDKNLKSVVKHPFGPYQPEPFINKPRKIFHVAIKNGMKSPFQVEEDFFFKDDHENEPSKIEIDFKNIQSRIIEVPLLPDNYDKIFIQKDKLFSLVSNKEKNEAAFTLRVANIEKSPKWKDVVNNLDDVSFGKKILIHKKNEIFIVDSDKIKLNINNSIKRVPLNNWTFCVDPKKEWRQIFLEVWNKQKNYFYDKNMHNVDWEKSLKKYLPLLDRITSRSELNDLISQLISELSASHMYVLGGERSLLKKKIPNMGFLGAVFEKNAKGFVISHIYKGDPADCENFSGLSDPTLEISEGDIIVKINGIDTLLVQNINQLLYNLAKKEVFLVIKKKNTNEIIYKKVTAHDILKEKKLRYNEWDYKRKSLVEKKGKSRIGYIHLQDMQSLGYEQWVKNYYPNYNREGLIIDLRHNRGGNIESWILEKLLRKVWSFLQNNSDGNLGNMYYAFRGHIVVLCNERTASDGEAFLEGFRKLKLGKIIGMRTSGVAIWINVSRGKLMDNGLVTIPEFGIFSSDKGWLIEGCGFEPDIVVDNLPHSTYKGKDQQLEAAIDYLLGKIEKDPISTVKLPPYPDKSSLSYN